MFGTAVSDLQTNVSVANNAFTGTIKYFDTPGDIVDVWGPGNFLVFKISDIDEHSTSVMVGLSPSEGSGPVEIIDDPDKNGIAKITDKDVQKFKVIQTDDAGHRNIQVYDLSGLTLEPEV